MATLIIFVVATALALAGLIPLLKYRFREWEQVEATVERSNPAKIGILRGVDIFRPNVVYRYTVGHRQYVGSSYAFSNREDCGPIENVQKLIEASYAPNSKVNVWIMAGHPGISSIKRGGHFFMLQVASYLVTSVAIFGLGAWVVFLRP